MQCWRVASTAWYSLRIICLVSSKYNHCLWYTHLIYRFDWNAQCQIQASRPNIILVKQDTTGSAKFQRLSVFVRICVLQCELIHSDFQVISQNSMWQYLSKRLSLHYWMVSRNTNIQWSTSTCHMVCQFKSTDPDFVLAMPPSGWYRASGTFNFEAKVGTKYIAITSSLAVTMVVGGCNLKHHAMKGVIDASFHACCQLN